MLAYVIGFISMISFFVTFFLFFLWIAYGYPYIGSLGMHWKKEGLTNLVPPDEIQHRFQWFSLSDTQSGWKLKLIYYAASLVLALVCALSLTLGCLLWMGGFNG